MRRACLFGIGLVAAATIGCLHSPVLWSPDGRWVAYATAVRPRERVLAPGWLFDTGAEDRSATPEARKAAGLKYRIWATRADTGESVLLEDGRGPLTSPGWHPDGTALAFGRVIPEGGGRARYEVVVQDAPDHQRVFQSRPLTELGPEVAELPALAVAWSPDGRYLAVPQIQPRGVSVHRADNGRLVAMLDDAYLASWSPDSAKLAFFKGQSPAALCWVDSNFGPARKLLEATNPVQPPVWTRDGQSVLVVLRMMRKRAGPPTADEARLMRVRVENGQTEDLRKLVGDGQAREGNVRSVSFSLDRDAEELLFAAHVDGMEQAITWYRTRDGAVYKRFNPLDKSIPIGALAVAPAGKRVALRAGPPDLLSPPAILNLERDGNEAFTALVPDDDARLEWVATLVAAARSILLHQVPPAMIGDEEVSRISLLPAPGELTAQHESLHRLRHLARIGLPLCTRPAGSPPADPELQARLDEARLLFSYLLGDRYEDALSALESVEKRTTDPKQRLGLLAVRAQIYLGLRDVEQAKATVGYLQSVQGRPPRRFEVMPDGRVALTADPLPGSRWPDYLAQRAVAMERGLEPGDEAAENPDAPPAAPGLDQQQDQLIPIEPMRNRHGDGMLPFAGFDREGIQELAPPNRFNPNAPPPPGRLPRRMPQVAPPPPPRPEGAPRL